MVSLVLLILGLSGCLSGLADGHTLRYYYTVISGKGSGLPEFSVVAYVDDQEILNYNSETHVVQPVTQWMEKTKGLEYWDRMTETLKAHESVLIHDMRRTLIRYNQTTGFHTYQKRYGCELKTDGSIAGFSYYGYDGQYFAYLDTQNWVYTAIIDHAQILTQAWNSQGVRRGEVVKKYMENICRKDLTEFLKYGEEELKKEVRPEVKVWGRRSGGMTKLQCLVYGFRPRAVDVKWVRNGKYDVPSKEAKTVLPHPDGTYQTRVSVEVPTNEEDTYSCHVDHSSLEKILQVTWDPSSGISIYLIVGAAIGCLAALLIAAVIVGRVIKKKQGYAITSNAETSSESSNTKG